MKVEGGKGTRVVSPARRAAFNILRRVEEEGVHQSRLGVARIARLELRLLGVLEGPDVRMLGQVLKCFIVERSQPVTKQ